MRFARGRKAAMSAPSKAETIASTTGNGDADRGVRHERIAAADGVDSAAPRCVSSHHRSSPETFTLGSAIGEEIMAVAL
jgi:hypothetical protein